MLKDKHGKKIQKDDWLVDVDDSLWEVRDCEVGEGNLTRLLEVLLFPDGVTFTLGETDRWLTRKEVSKMERMW